MRSRRQRIRVSATCLTLVLLVLTLGACATTQPVRPYPSFIEAAIEPGDKVKVTTTKSEKSVFVVAEISKTALIGDEQHIAFEDIRKIELYSHEPPKYPCGGEVPLGCSVPALAKAVEQQLLALWLNNLSFGLYSKEDPFHFDCVQHDFCYRHGFSTYAHDQKTCDHNFRDDMFETCSIDPACRLLATQYHAAVRREGRAFFRTDDSTYCEYDGPPSNKVKTSAN